MPRVQDGLEKALVCVYCSTCVLNFVCRLTDVGVVVCMFIDIRVVICIFIDIAAVVCMFIDIGVVVTRSTRCALNIYP